MSLLRNPTVTDLRSHPGADAARLFAGVGGALAIASWLAPAGLGGIAFFALAVAAPGAIAYGTKRYRPVPSWPWWGLVVSGALFTLGGLVRHALDTTGDLSATRNLVPDAFVLPGYALFALSLLGLLRSRQRRNADDAAALDGAILALGSLVLAWVLLLDPVLGRDAAVIAKIAIAVYPPISVFLVAIAARLAFATGVRNSSYRLLLAGMLFMLVGDVVYALVEGRFIVTSEQLTNLPYAFSYAAVGAAALHPSMRDLGSWADPRTELSQGRAVLVAVALLTPALLVLAWVPSSAAERVVAGVLAVALTALAIGRVLTAMRQQAVIESRLAFRATHDELTGLPNRSQVFARIDDELERARHGAAPLAVVFLDLDQFKLVNDTFGHAAGDRLLVEAGQRLVALVDPDHLVARLSGDEFIVVASECDVGAARSLAERIRTAFVEPLHSGIDQFVTASIGVVVSDGRGAMDAAAMLRDADTAMYRSKDSGRNAVTVFDVAMRTRIARRVQLERDLRYALASGALELHYQPIVALGSGRPEGVEALLRWRTPSGWISPSEFVAVAEDSALIIPLGEWVLERACTDLAAWTRDHPDVPLSFAVNLSPRQLRHCDVAALTADVLERTGARADALWLEITETVMMEDTLDTMAALDGLRELGVRLAADDFGTGFSSLSYLKRFPIDRVKIDRSFMSGLESSDGSLVEAILAIARTMQMDVVAEGIETTQQSCRLASLGCQYGQGWLFAPAVPFADLPGVLAPMVATASSGASGRWS